MVDISCLYDGNTEINFLVRPKLRNAPGDPMGDPFNPEGKLTGATYGVYAGDRLYVTTSRGLAVIDVN